MFRAMPSVRLLFVPLLSALALGSSGCWPARTDESVLVVLRGGSESARWQATEDLLPYLVDDPHKRLHSWNAWGGHPPEQIRLAPVADPKGFADRVLFGVVEKIDDRTIYIRLDEEKTQAQAMLARVAHFFDDLPNKVRGYWLLARVEVIAWWTGRSTADVFWSVVWSDAEQAAKAVDTEANQP
jgi:hypothetical protein